MAEFISNGLKGSIFYTPLEILGISHDEIIGKFCLPYIEISDKDEVIILCLGDKFIPTDKENVIEITSKEFCVYHLYNN